MNIQFMEKTITVKDSWSGKDTLAYVPDFDELVVNASCKEEVEAIRHIEKVFEEYKSNGHESFASFPFQIVYMRYGKSFDPITHEMEMKWQMYQHPWHQCEGVKCTKEQMIKNIEKFCAEY